MNPDPRLLEITDCLYRVAVKAIIIKDKKVLLVRDDPEDKWGFPGGGIDYGESAPEALVRELHEELGVTESLISSDFKVVAVTAGHIKNTMPRTNLYYIAFVPELSEDTKKDIVELQWFRLEELPEVEFDEANGDITELLTILQELLS